MKSCIHNENKSLIHPVTRRRTHQNADVLLWFLMRVWRPPFCLSFTSQPSDLLAGDRFRGDVRYSGTAGYQRVKSKSIYSSSSDKNQEKYKRQQEMRTVASQHSR